MASKGLQGLVGELIDNICAYLSKDDIKQLRLTSRELKTKSDRGFAVKFFRKVSIMITGPSLSKMLEISRDPVLSSAVKELKICLVTFIPEMNVVRVNGHKHYRGFHRNMMDQNTLRKQSVDVELLSCIMKNLPALESITLLQHFNLDDRALGWEALQAEIGMRPPTSDTQLIPSHGLLRDWAEHLSPHYARARDRFQHFNKHVIALVFGALLRSGKTLKKSLSIVGAPAVMEFLKTKDDDITREILTPGSTFAAEDINNLAAPFAGLEELSLSSFEYKAPSIMMLSRRNDNLSWLVDYFTAFSAVKSLTLSGFSHSSEASIVKFLAASAESGFPTLKSLSLQELPFNTKDLINFLDTHPSLEALKMRDSYPIYGSGTYGRILEVIQAAPCIREILLYGTNDHALTYGYHGGPPGMPYGSMDPFRSCTKFLTGLNYDRISIKENTAADLQKLLGVYLEQQVEEEEEI
ncbi:hypothetical protein EJ04DRAFT_560657 [Polyplosphaeria fusca]|uniref:F-box domain-containing protein n=1 Tax=Polyplosphaeria fusca TaxID=682080 RepID=A0A9P4V6M7_9PLEO|nr:hypothetical protein EJ04DRAFT_560657 [Polyplosphaeria fusca]